jgi:hypothetical protein
MTNRIAIYAATSVAAAFVAGCAQLTADSASPEAQCQNFARLDGLAVTDVLGASAVSGGHDVRLRLLDGLGRRFEATCTTAGGPRWTQPLPANVVRSNTELRK